MPCAAYRARVASGAIPASCARQRASADLSVATSAGATASAAAAGTAPDLIEASTSSGERTLSRLPSNGWAGSAR